MLTYQLCYWDGLSQTEVASVESNYGVGGLQVPITPPAKQQRPVLVPLVILLRTKDVSPPYDAI